MKVSFAANQAEMGGGEVMVLAMAEAARRAGHAARVVGPPGELTDRARARGLPTIEINASGAAGYLRGLRAWARATRPELLWCTGLRPAAATAGLPHRVVHLHSLPRRQFRAGLPAVTLGASRVVVPSEWMRVALRLPAVTVLPNWTDDLPYEPHVPARDGSLRVGFLGRLTSDKGVLVLADAMDRLARTNPGRFRLVVGGVPRFERDAVGTRIESRLGSLTPAAEQQGWVETAAFLRGVDVAVFPSVAPESFGLVAAEAMAAGCPFVVTTAGALPEVTAHPGSFVAPPGDPGGLATAIVAASTSYTRAHLDASRARWEGLYSPGVGGARWAHLVQSLEHA